MDKKILVSLIILFVVFIAGCSTGKADPDRETQGVRSEQQKEGSPVPGVKEIPKAENASLKPGGGPKINLGAYSSPGRQAAVAMMGQHDPETGITSTDFYLLDKAEQNLIYSASLGGEWEMPVIWVSDSQVLLQGTWLYDRTAREGKKVAPQEVAYIWDWELNKDRSLLALAGKTSTSPANIAVWVVNLLNGETVLVHSYPPVEGWTGDIDFEVSWDLEDTLYFDADYQGKPAIYSYKHGGRQAEVFIVNAWAPAVSPDGQYIAYLDTKGYYRQSGQRTKIREFMSGDEMALGEASGQKYWSPYGHYLVFFEGTSIEYYRILSMEGNNNFQVKTIKAPAPIRFISFIDPAQILALERVMDPKTYKYTESVFHVFGPEPESGEVWKASREYMQSRGYTVGLDRGDMVLMVENIFDNRAIVVYGPSGSEFYAELLLTKGEDANWRVVADQLQYNTYYYEEAQEAIEVLAAAKGYDFDGKPGSMKVGIKDAYDDFLSLVVAKYGWPWSMEYDVERVNGKWAVRNEKEFKDEGAELFQKFQGSPKNVLEEFLSAIVAQEYSKAYTYLIQNPQQAPGWQPAALYLEAINQKAVKIIKYLIGEPELLNYGNRARIQVELTLEEDKSSQTKKLWFETLVEDEKWRISWFTLPESEGGRASVMQTMAFTVER